MRTKLIVIALAEGLNYVFTGNVHDQAGGSTYCSGCKKPLIVRDWYRILTYTVSPDGKCPHCRTAIAGRYETFRKAFGPRRVPVRLANTQTS